MSLRDVPVVVRVPDEFKPRAVWALNTMLAQIGCRAVSETDDRVGDACLAYASSPVPGVPTIPCSRVAMELIAQELPLPPASYESRPVGSSMVVGAFGAPTDGFAVDFDLVSSAFIMLACWDEFTSDERDQYGRLPYSASVFARNPRLDITEPMVDRYVDVLRDVIGRRLRELGEPPLADHGWIWAASRGTPAPPRSFAIALTHDLDNLWRWTPRGFAAAAFRSARAVRRRDLATVRREAGDVGDWLIRHLPRRSDPYWTFDQMIGGEDARGVDSTFYVIARHTHPRDGNQPRTYRKRLPAAITILRTHDREVGLHGNHADRVDLQVLQADLERLAHAGGQRVEGMRYHYLRCLYHETLPLLEEAGVGYDTSLAFAEHEGYRCGCSFPFRPYSLKEERALDLVELPLAVMDGTLQQAHYRGLGPDDAETAAHRVLDQARKSGGAAGLLWHNNRFDRRVALGYDDVYWHLVDRLLDEGAWVTSAGRIVARWREATGFKPTRVARATASGSPRRTSHGGRKGPVVLHVSVVHKPDDPRIYERECRSLADAGYRVAYLSPGSERGIDESGVLNLGVPARSRRTRLLAARDIVRTVKTLRPAVVHVHDPELLTLFPVLRSLVPRLVYDMHEYVPEAVANKPYIPSMLRPLAAAATASAQKSLAMLADGVVVVTDAQLVALGHRPALRLVLPNYPRLERFDGARPVEDLAADPRLKLIYIGSLSRARGCLAMLDVMERLSDAEAVLYLGGTFNEASLEVEVRDRLAAGLADRVRLLGRVPPPELPRYLASADVVWVPEQPDRQYRHPTVPTKVFEGMAMRRAVLVSDMAGRGELVRGESCGLAVPPGVDGHLAGIRRLLGQRDALADMGERGRTAVERSYSWEAIAAHLVDFYGSLCADLPGTRTASERPSRG